MADASYLQTNFQGGEWSNTFQGRLDDPRYKTSLRTCKNALPIEEGAWTRRPGFKLGALTRGGVPGRCVEFEIEQQSPVTLEFSNGHIRCYVDGRLGTTNDEQAISAISTANPAVVTTAAAHGWSTGDQGIIDTLGTPDGLLENRQLAFTVTGSTTLTIADAVSGAAINGATLQTFTSGTVRRFFDLVSPYSGADWKDLKVIPAQDGMIILHENYAPYFLSVTTFPSSGTDPIFSIAKISFLDGPYLDPVGGGALVTPNGTTGIVSLAVSLQAYVATKAYKVGDLVNSGGASYQSLIDQNLGNTPASSPAAWTVVHASIAVGPNGFQDSDIGRAIRMLDGAGHWTWGRITGLLNAIGGNPVGSSTFGDSGDPGILFDGVTAKDGTASVETQSHAAMQGGDSLANDLYGGKNYGASNKQVIKSATIYPSLNDGLAWTTTERTDGVIRWRVYCTLYGSQTNPTSRTNGTVLGETKLFPPLSTGVYDHIYNPGVISIISNDQTTAWQYVWVNIQIFVDMNTGFLQDVTHRIYCAQMVFYNPTGSSGDGVQAEILGPDLSAAAAISTWRLGLYTQDGGFPTCGTYHEGRLWLSGSIKNRFDGSVSNDLFNFAPTAANGTVADSNAIDYVMNAPDVNSILWMKPDQQGILIGTEREEWLVQASTLNSPLTPTNIQAHRVTRIGSSVASAAVPVQTEHTTVFIQRYKRKLMEYFPDVFSGKFSAPNIALPAGHLTARGLAELAYQQSVTPVIWARCDDGSLIGCSYKRETLMSSQGPTFAGWHQHTHGGGRTFSYITVGPSSDGTLDTLAAVTLDPNANSHVEFLTPIFGETDALADAQFLDGFIVPTVTQNVTFNGAATMQLTGLWPLEGKAVTVFAGGIDCGDHTVTNGKINVTYGSDPLGVFTVTFVANYSGTMPVIAGFTYTSDGQLPRPALPQEAGTRTGPAIGKKHRQSQVIASLVNTRGISFGGNLSKLRAAQLRSEGDTLIAANATFTGTYRHALEDSDTYDDSLCWRVSRPFPAIVAALGGMIQTTDD